MSMGITTMEPGGSSVRSPMVAKMPAGPCGKRLVLVASELEGCPCAP